MQSGKLRDTARGWRTFVTIVSGVVLFGWLVFAWNAAQDPFSGETNAGEFLVGFLIGAVGIALSVGFYYIGTALLDGTAEMIDRLDNVTKAINASRSSQPPSSAISSSGTAQLERRRSGPSPDQPSPQGTTVTTAEAVQSAGVADVAPSGFPSDVTSAIESAAQMNEAGADLVIDLSQGGAQAGVAAIHTAARLVREGKVTAAAFVNASPQHAQVLRRASISEGVELQDAPGTPRLVTPGAP